MSGNFSRIITLLRKEKCVTQKEAAAQLSVSQALLSHYEKGIRECGLDFVVRAAEYYSVSCDYLLGRSADRTGATLSVDDIPNPEEAKDSEYKGSVLPTLNKKLISNSLNVLFDKLNSCPDKALVTEISGYLMISVYKMFRHLYSSNAKNSENLFSVSLSGFSEYSNAAMGICEANIKGILKGDDVGLGSTLKDFSSLLMTTQTLMREYPLYTPSLLNLIKTTELRLDRFFGAKKTESEQK